MNTKVIIGVISAVILIILLFWITLFVERPSNMETYNASTTYPWMEQNATSSDNGAALTYEDTQKTFTVSYPKELTASTSVNNDLFGSVVSFLFPAVMSEGTNLSEDSRISIEEKNTTDCLPTSFVEQSMIGDDEGAIKTEVVGENTFKTFGFADAGAGNFYENSVYSISKGNKCFGVRLFVHSGNIGNYDPGTIKEYDKAKVQTFLRSVLEGFKINS